MIVAKCDKCGGPSYLQSRKQHRMGSGPRRESDIWEKTEVFKCPADGEPTTLVTHYGPWGFTPQPREMQDERCGECAALCPLQSMEENLIQERSDFDGESDGVDLWEMKRVFKCPVDEEFERTRKFLERRPEISVSPQ